MSRRDSQRGKLYTAERKAFEGAPVDLPEVEDVERFIAHICKLGRVKESFPELEWRSITVGDGRNCTGLLDASLFENIAIEADAGDCLTGKIVTKSKERI